MTNCQELFRGEEDDVPLISRRSLVGKKEMKRKQLCLDDEDECEPEKGEVREYKKQRNKKEGSESESEDENKEDAEEVESENEWSEEPNAQPIGEVVRVSREGESRRKHYESFEFDGITYNLEDLVLLVPEEIYQKPSVAMIKDITQTQEGGTMLTIQRFYRPEETKEIGGGNWQAHNVRKLFYSFDRDEEFAESVMHKCTVHFIPLNKQIPHQKQHPGFIVQNVYDPEQRRLFELTDKVYEDGRRHEIDILVQNTITRLGDLPDLEPVDNDVDLEDQRNNKRDLEDQRNNKCMLGRNASCLDAPGKEEETCKFRQSGKAVENPENISASTSKYYAILSHHKVLTGVSPRDR